MANGWPVFDYVEGTFDLEREDAAAILASFPRVGQWGYGALWWAGIGQSTKPAPETKIELTLVGMHHTSALRPMVPIFFEVVELMIAIRRESPVAPSKPREIFLDEQDVKSMLRPERHLLKRPTKEALLFGLLAREPATFHGGRTESSDGSWVAQIRRDVDEYEGVTSIEDYVERLERLTAVPHQRPSLAAPSPLGLVSVLDYLDAIWRVRHRTGLFEYPSAERVAKLAFPAQSSDELSSRLSSLAEILRTANASARAVAPKTRLPKPTRAKPLARFEAYLLTIVDASSAARVEQAITEIEHAIAIRDAGQHAEAGHRAVLALNAFQIGHPVVDFDAAWDTITSRVIEALGAIREELASDGRSAD